MSSKTKGSRVKNSLSCMTENIHQQNTLIMCLNRQSVLGGVQLFCVPPFSSTEELYNFNLKLYHICDIHGDDLENLSRVLCISGCRYGISPESIILYGQSIGTVPTVDLASRYECAAVVLHSPLTSGMRVAFPDTKKTYCFDAFPK